MSEQKNVYSEANVSDLNKKNLNGKLRKFMYLRLGSRHFAVQLSDVREVIGLGQITILPNMPAYFAGLINLRGKIISTVYLQKSMNFVYQEKESKESKESKRPCVVITEIHGRFFGAIADDVVEVTAVSEEQIDRSVENLSNKEVFSGIIKKNETDLAPILNLEKALKLNELMPLKITA